MRIAYSAISGNYTPLWIAAETGAFKEVGVDAQLVYISGGPVLTQALLAGDVNIGFSNGGSAIQAIQSGADLLIIGVAVDRFIFSLMARPEIRTVADLKGKRLGVVRLGGATDIAARVALERSGLTPHKDVALLQIGGIGEILAALRGGSIDAGILSPPTVWRAEKLGLRELVDVTAMGVAYPNPAIVTKRTYSRSHAEEVHKFMRAYAVGGKRMKTNEALTKKVLTRYTRTEDPEIIDRLYQFYAFKILQKAPYITPAAIKSAISEVAEKTPQIQNVPATTFYDERFVKDLETSGFLQKLYP
jgi:ABC-type nitrate/sulfonate/bicarbonate transport system substrate-binding protein